MEKKKILILAGGTATAWHLSCLIKKDFEKDFVLCVGDINESSIIPASTLADKCFKLPKIVDKSYYPFMINLLQAEKINILVPLIDFDLSLFANDNQDLLKMNVFSTAPSQKTMNVCKSKNCISKLFQEKKIAVPKHFAKIEINNNTDYFVKPDSGFGSKDAGVVKGKNIHFSSEIIVQEILNRPELTVEVFKKNHFLYSVCRERIETKAGVCTKSRFLHIPEIEEIIVKISNIIELPLGSCMQFMKNTEDKWCLTDLNLRLGAGTALTTAAGSSIAAAFLSVLAGKDNYKDYLKQIPENRIVVRVYDEIIMQ